MDDLDLRSSDQDPLRPLQPLLSSVAENASNLAAAVKRQHDQDHETQHVQPQLDNDEDAQSLQPLHSAVAEYDGYDVLQQQQQPGTQPPRPEDAYSALMVSR